jgi:hypothetical protein
MNEFGREISRNMPETGRPDPERVRGLQRAVLEGFDRKMRRSERIFYVYFVLQLFFAMLSALAFFRTNEIKMEIFYGLIFLACFEGTILIKLWYWITNNKVGVLKEIRLLRLDLMAAGMTPPGREEEFASPPELRRSRLPKKERWLWTLLVVVVALGIGESQYMNYWWSRWRETESHHTRIIRLQPDGMGQMTSIETMLNTSPVTLSEINWLYSGKDCPIIAIRDGWGRKLPMRSEPAEENLRYFVKLIDPVPSGKPFTLETQNNVLLAIKQDDAWTFNMASDWGAKKNIYQDTVVLPPGAEVISAEPRPARIEQEGNSPVLHFEGTTKAGEKWRYTIRYRRPKSAQ